MSDKTKQEQEFFNGETLLTNVKSGSVVDGKKMASTPTALELLHLFNDSSLLLFIECKLHRNIYI